MNKNDVKEVLWNLAKEWDTDEFTQVARFALCIANDVWANELLGKASDECVKATENAILAADYFLISGDERDKAWPLGNACHALGGNERERVACAIIGNTVPLVILQISSTRAGVDEAKVKSDYAFESLWDFVVSVACGYEVYGFKCPGLGYDIEAALEDFCKGE